MLQINSETAHKMFIQLMERFDKIEKMLERQNKMKECLDGDTLLDNYDLSIFFVVFFFFFRVQGLLRAEGLTTSGKHEK